MPFSYLLRIYAIYSSPFVFRNYFKLSLFMSFHEQCRIDVDLKAKEISGSMTFLISVFRQFPSHKLIQYTCEVLELLCFFYFSYNLVLFIYVFILLMTSFLNVCLGLLSETCILFLLYACSSH
jgi:hypothetical protein